MKDNDITIIEYTSGTLDFEIGNDTNFGDDNIENKVTMKVNDDILWKLDNITGEIKDKVLEKMLKKEME